MVQGFAGVTIGVNARPCLPDGGSTLFDLIEPAGGGILQQQLVSGVRMAILCQHLTEEGRGKEAGVQVIAVFRHYPVQRIRSSLALLLAKGNGTDVFTLAVGSDGSIIRKGSTVCLHRLFCRVTILRCVLCLAQRLCNFCQKPPGISQIRRTHAFAGVHHRLHGGNARLTPFAVVQTVQHRMQKAALTRSVLVHPAGICA